MTEEQRKNRNKRQNAWTAQNYDRQSVIIPKTVKERIKAAGETSINGYINRLILEDLKKRGV